jgi:3-dehydroquinate dehydratase I
LTGNKPRICATIAHDDVGAIKAVGPLVDLFEARIDLIGRGWQEMIRHLDKPWIACNRTSLEGGSWKGSEADRIDELLKALDLGAHVIDIELNTPDIQKIINKIRGNAEILVSLHDFKRTPSLPGMREIIKKQIAIGADICKLVTTARSFDDNLSVSQLISDFPGKRLVAFAMGALGITSRILCPLVGGDFTYASIARGKESAPGQLTVQELTRIYKMLNHGK